VDVVSIQHEYGIWGGRDGDYVLDFLREIRRPTVVTLHTVLPNPSPSQRRILISLMAAADATVVMSPVAASLLTDVYGVYPGRVDEVPHGVPTLPLAAPASMKSRLGLDSDPLILSFGLLGPGKGYEAAIAAMPLVAEEFPAARYVILGATHPEILRREGETYRRSLEACAASLGAADRVIFVDRFVTRRDLGTWLGAADIFVTPYPNLDQIASGTLAYAMGAGKAIVSTPYAHASELLADGRGRIVEPGSPPALAAVLIDLLRHPNLRDALGRRAYDHSRSMVWPAVGARYRRIFARVADQAVLPAGRSRKLSAVSG
jgi:glycosyltransferase involved in cell wall biosynthesis